MTQWDVFHSERLEVQRGLSLADVRAALASEALRDDDLIRPAGTTVPWARIADLPELATPVEAPDVGPERPFEGDDAFAAPSLELRPEDAGASSTESEEDEEDEEDTTEHTQFVIDDEPGPLDAAEFSVIEPESDSGRNAIEMSRFDLDLDRDQTESRLALPVGEEADDSLEGLPRSDEDLGFAGDEAEFDPQEEDEEAAAFTLARGGPEKVEELDLAAMVDVAFQLVLFFLVTATTVLYKTLEVPKPSPEKPPEAAAQGPTQGKTIEELEDAYILVNIDPLGHFTIDREPVIADFNALIERLRKARADTGRTAMLLTAEAATLHRFAVLAYDAANEIGLRIAIAKPGGPGSRPSEPSPAPPRSSVRKGQAG